MRKEIQKLTAIILTLVMVTGAFGMPIKAEEAPPSLQAEPVVEESAGVETPQAEIQQKDSDEQEDTEIISTLPDDSKTAVEESGSDTDSIKQQEIITEQEKPEEKNDAVYEIRSRAMRKYSSREVRCFVCGQESVQTTLVYADRQGYPDLDARPPEPLRGTYSLWVQECPNCGYVSASVSDPTGIEEHVTVGYMVH